MQPTAHRTGRALSRAPRETITVSTPLMAEFPRRGSLNAHLDLAEIILRQLESPAGVKFQYVAILLAVFSFASLRGIKNKPECMARETECVLERHGSIAFKRNPYVPVNTLRLMRGAV